MKKLNIKELFKIDKTVIKYFWMIFAVLVIDHTIKIIVYNNFELHQGIRLVGDWIRIKLELNDGTAFAVPFNSELDRYFKIALKILVLFILLLALLYFLNKKESKLVTTGLALCFSGTLGNLIDRIFFGVLLNNNLGIYSFKWFHGRVIDMFSFQLFEIHIPNWFPSIGGNNYIFFEPIFNFADLILVIGGVLSFIGLVKIRNNKKLLEKWPITK